MNRILLLNLFIISLTAGDARNLESDERKRSENNVNVRIQGDDLRGENPMIQYVESRIELKKNELAQTDVNNINYKHNNLNKDSKNRENSTNNEKKSKIIQDFNFQIKSSDNKKTITSNDLSSFILVNRWIGIDSLMLVHFSGKNNFNLFFDALKEKKISGTENTFYESTFGLSEHKINIGINKNILKGNTLPGFITFLYYTGNLFFVCIILFFIVLIFNYFEMYVKKISLGNSIFACFLSNLIATRLVHFGYAPKDSYLFILSIIFAVLLMYILSRFNNHFLIKNKKN